jgi:putative endonuclease
MQLSLYNISHLNPLETENRDTKARKRLGDAGERLAAGKLETLGYRLVEINWRCRYGELDIIAWHEKCLVFIEVRTRFGDAAGSPEESITPRKLATLNRVAELYLQAHPELLDARHEPPDCRIDLVAIQFAKTGQLIRLEVIENITV